MSFTISEGIEFLRPVTFQTSIVTWVPEHTTPVIEQQAVLLEDDTWVDFPINCHDRTTQQHCGEPELHEAWDSTPKIKAERLNARIEYSRDG